MLLTGTYPRTLDEKLRVAIPKPLRDAMGGKDLVLYVAPGNDGSLGLYTEQVLQLLAEKLNRTPNASDVRAFGRLFYAQAKRAELDSQGRIRIPPELATSAQLEREVVLIGVHDHLELWNPTRWDNYLTEKRDHYDEIAEKAFSSSG